MVASKVAGFALGCGGKAIFFFFVLTCNGIILCCVVVCGIFGCVVLWCVWVSVGVGVLGVGVLGVAVCMLGVEPRLVGRRQKCWGRFSRWDKGGACNVPEWDVVGHFEGDSSGKGTDLLVNVHQEGVRPPPSHFLDGVGGNAI